MQKLIKDKCAIFIPTYNRADRVYTYEVLRKQNYTGKIYLVLGNDDPQIKEYQERYGKEWVLIFDKEKVAKSVDVMDNFGKRKAVVFARNVMWDLAKSVGIDYFLVLDDDYNEIWFRRMYGEQIKMCRIKNLDNVIYNCFNYLFETPMIDCFAWCQSGDFIGGGKNGGFEKVGKKRKIMNAFFFRASKKVPFMGSLNEDLNASVYNGQRGMLLWTINDVSINQKLTQSNAGGLTDIYLDLGTYVKSFYSVMAAPNCVRIHTTGNNDLRLHHRVDWNLAVPKLIREQYKKR